MALSHFSITDRVSVQAAALLLASSLAAGHRTQQPNLQATALTELRVTASNSPQPQVQTLPIQTDVSTGFTIQALASPTPQNPISSRATSTATVQRSGESITFEWVESVSAGFGFLGSQGRASFGPHEIELVFTHPTARAMDLVIERCLGRNAPGSGVGVSGALTLPDGRVFAGTPTSSGFTCVFTPYAEVDTVPVTIDRNGYRVVLATDGYGIGSLRGGTGTTSSSWRITLRPAAATPCAAISYGQGCGPSLMVVQDPTLGPLGFRATLDDPARPSAAWSVAGGQRLVLPLPPSCDLLNDALIIAPWPIDAQGHAELALVPTTGQVFALQLQAATFANGLRLSNGFEFACR